MDRDFEYDRERLIKAVDLLGRNLGGGASGVSLPNKLPELGLGFATLDLLAPIIIGGAAQLGTPSAFAHMDPPTPSITWAVSLWTAALNQNLLHPSTAPVAREIEQQVVRWLAPWFGMDGGHMTAGSTLANLTALWVARDLAGAREVVASSAAHVSVGKAARLLGMQFRTVRVDDFDRMDASDLGDVSQACLVLTAGTTGVGAIDPLDLVGAGRWTHVDAAWAGPMQLSDAAQGELFGMEGADSIAVSAHKWLFQPKDSALVFFKDTDLAHRAISFGGGYLAAENVGVLGSSAARAVPLAATLIAWGRRGVAERIDRCRRLASGVASEIAGLSVLELFAEPVCGVVAWRPRAGDVDPIAASAPPGIVSTTQARGARWLRFVAANPNADAELLLEFVSSVAASTSLEP